MSIARSGYVCVSQCIDNQALEILRKEADHLFRLKCARGVLSEDEYFDKVWKFACHLLIRVVVSIYTMLYCSLSYIPSDQPRSGRGYLLLELTIYMHLRAFHHRSMLC